MTQELVAEFTFGCARDFLNAISPHGDLFGAFEPQQTWLFRGQASASWPLTPSGFRRCETNLPWVLAHGRFGRSKPDEVLAEPCLYYRGEMELITRFVSFADQQGLPIPGDGTDLRKRLDERRKDGSLMSPSERVVHCNPSDEFFGLLALLQHHGNPTRLLDWTRHATFAAYFAALESDSRLDDDLAVWGVYAEALRYDRFNEARTARLKIVRVATATNPNLRAQDGVFTVHEFGHACEDVSQLCVFKDFPFHESWYSHPIFYKFVLPHRESPRLL